ncbi:hypothetical protein [Halobacterium sp. R2-5]|uniref:hypothetical protein n=1 Tax=Halobacterium sp. R2-5 TaxID=2715751 RepID=UPI0014232948|nr:hypothetical protein [Halobacterium sp. R2-5]NIB98258.1 hypothetical protein [Halobacterium sp. R2-5]
MTLDVSIPDSPDLSNRGAPEEFEWTEDTGGAEDFRREDIEALLEEGAWAEGFNEWAEYTSMSEQQVRAVDDLGLFQDFDFYWDPTQDRLRADPPELPEDWRDRDATASWNSSTVAAVESELQDLGDVVYEALEDYLEDDDVSEHYWSDRDYGDRGE